MNPVIEKVARAIAASAASAFGDRAIHYVENNWGAYTNQARAAISSLREPTDAMLHRIPGAMHDAREASWIAMWQDMIDQALRED